MHNIKDIRKNPKNFSDLLKTRTQKESLTNKYLSLDVKIRNLIKNKELLEQEKKKISKLNDKSLFKKSKELSIKIDDLEQQVSKNKTTLNNFLSELPNLPLADVPIGKDESSNIILYEKGSIPKFDFKPKSHEVIGKNLNMIDFDLASKTSGSRFVFLKSSIAQLERALSAFMLDTHTKKNGYIEISPPLIANISSMFGTGQLPKFENDQFEIKLDQKNDKKYLIPTAEVILTNIVREKTILQKDLPIRLVASTSCFRKEAGSYGKDTKGMIRQHQFYKVELVSVVEPKNSKEELERMTACAEDILLSLKLPYRKVLLSTGDMGFSAEKTYDLEVWIPSENQYREISSCSSCGQFQARRMKSKFKNEKNESDFVVTLNGSGLAVGRSLIAIIENYQEKDGSIIIPDVLKPYMNGQDLIR